MPYSLDRLSVVTYPELAQRLFEAAGISDHENWLIFEVSGDNDRLDVKVYLRVQTPPHGCIVIFVHSDHQPNQECLGQVVIHYVPSPKSQGYTSRIFILRRKT